MLALVTRCGVPGDGWRDHSHHSTVSLNNSYYRWLHEDTCDSGARDCTWLHVDMLTQRPVRCTEEMRNYNPLFIQSRRLKCSLFTLNCKLCVVKTIFASRAEISAHCAQFATISNITTSWVSFHSKNTPPTRHMTCRSGVTRHYIKWAYICQKMAHIDL